MITRKVQKTGGGTYTISLPKEWAKERVKKGDTLFLFEEENELTIRAKKPKKEKRRIEIEFTGSVASLIKKVIASYLEGYERIIVRSEEQLEEREKIKHEIRKNLAGIEIISESTESIVVKSLVSFEKISFENSLSKLYFLVETMLENLLAYLKNGEEIEEKLESQEEEVDSSNLFSSSCESGKTVKFCLIKEEYL